MTLHSVHLTISEASFVLDRAAKALNHAIDRGEIAKIARAPDDEKGPSRYLGPAELRFLKLASEIDGDLTPAGRRRVYEAIRGLPPGEKVLRMGVMTIDLDPLDEILAARIARLRMLKGETVTAPDGEILLAGTDVPVHMVGALGDGQTVSQILADYPSLCERQVRIAMDYARAYPKSGRPYPRRSFKRRMAAFAMSGLLEDVEESVTPRVSG